MTRHNGEANTGEFPVKRRSMLRLSQNTLVKAEPLEGSLPLVVRPVVNNLRLTDWVEGSAGLVDEWLKRYGAILFRGFAIGSVPEFERFITVTSGEPLPYSERSSPRSRVDGNIYTSTDYPPDQSIFLHNEQSYNHTFPTRIFFYCMAAAQTGGQTPIADTRRIFARLNLNLRRRFEESGYRYVRNFGNGFGLDWPTAFQTSDRCVVEAYCRRNDIHCEWKEGNRLRTSQRRQAVAKHPVTAELAWFNHATFFHVSTLAPGIRSRLLAECEEEDLPNNTYYGDGTPIEPSVLEELRAAYLAEKTVFAWCQEDVLMLDNLLVAHGREPYEGPRRVLVGMAKLCRWSDL